MKKKVLIAIGLVLLASAAVWRFGLAPRWTQRIPPRWKWESDFIGIQTFADPQTLKMPDRDSSGTYLRSNHIVAENERPRSVEIKDGYLIRDAVTNPRVLPIGSPICCGGLKSEPQVAVAVLNFGQVRVAKRGNINPLKIQSACRINNLANPYW